MGWTDTYKLLADEIEATITDIPDAVAHISNCRFILLNLETTSEVGMEAETTLSSKMNQFYRFAKNHWYIVSQRRNIIKAINDFTVRQFGDLTTFVNSVPWDNGCVPYNWAEISEEIGYDTSEWIVCS